jgi:hypothetical protein
MLDWVFQLQDAAFGLRLVAHVSVLLAHAHHHARVLRPAHDRREHRARRVVAGKASLHHAAAVVNDQSRSLITVSHVVLL